MHWNLSWAFTVNISVYKEGSVLVEMSKLRSQARSCKRVRVKIPRFYIESDLMKVNNFFELRMNKSEMKLLFILLIWELWMVNYSSKGIHFYAISFRFEMAYYKN